MSKRFWLGVDLGGTKILAGLLDSQWKVLHRVKIPTGAEEGPLAVLARIRSGISELLTASKIDPNFVGGMGLGIPGQIEPQSRIVRFAPNLAWRDFDLLAHRPPEWNWPLTLENDVRVGTYAEWKLGSAQGARHVLGIFVGTGVGGCLILNGELYHGFNGHAGEIGHTVLHWRKGHTLEGIAGRRWLAKRAEELLSDAPKRVRKEWRGIDPSTIKSSLLAEFYARDDPIAIQLIDDSARAVGASIGSQINFLSPEVVVLGGGITEALGDAYLERVQEIALRYTLPKAAEGVRFVRASLGDDAGIIGAAVLAASKAPPISERFSTDASIDPKDRLN